MTSFSPFVALLRTVLALLFLAHASAAAAEDASLQAFKNRSLAEKLGSPRKTLETLCFSVDAYDRFPDRIADAKACLDLDREATESGAAELLAFQLDEILDELSLPFIGLSGGTDGKPVSFYEDAKIKIVLQRDKEGQWRVDRDTVARIPVMRLEMAARAKQRSNLRAGLREGLEDPTATMTTFLAYAIAGDYESAAARLDLGHLPLEQRTRVGPFMAWKLACVIQRRGYVYRQTVPVDPSGPPYTWSANASGRVVLERVHQAGGRDTWLFSRATVQAIDAMWQREKGRQPDPRYQFLGKVVPPPPEVAPESLRSRPPANVPPHLASPRAMLHAFFQLLEQSEYEDGKLSEVQHFFDMSHLSEESVHVVGPKVATMLEVVFGKLRPDLSTIPDHWSAPPQVLLGAGGLRVEIVRGENGWRFSSDTVARVPAMYESISGREKAERERNRSQSNPRETLVTFLRAVKRRDAATLEHCLDLSDFPASARDDLAPVLAVKLKCVLDHTGRIYLQEVPNDPDGPQVVLHRNQGRIVLARRDDDPTKAWRFTAATCSQIEDLYDQTLGTPVRAGTAAAEPNAFVPLFRHEPGIWLRARMPAAWRETYLGLDAYQWIGIPILLLVSSALAFLAGRIVYFFLIWAFHVGAAQADRELIGTRLGAIRFLAFFGVAYHLVEWLDLPSDVASVVFSLDKFFLAGALVYAGFQWTDLGNLFYERSRSLDAHRGLGDLVIPFTGRIVKVAVVLVALTYLVYQFGSGDSLKQFLTGLGVAGLAVSLAAQDSLKNLFATVLLISDRTFRVGDRLKVGEKEGTVEEVGFRSTKLRTPEDSVLVLPNAQLAFGAIDNLGARLHRRIKTKFAVTTRTPLDRVLALRDQLREYLAARPEVDAKRVAVYLREIEDGDMEVEVIAYVAVRDSAGEYHARDALTTEIVRRAATLEVELATGKPWC